MWALFSAARDIELLEPYAIVDGIADVMLLEELCADIKSQITLGAHLPYWESLLVVCVDEIANLKMRNTAASSSADSSCVSYVLVAFSTA